VVGADLPVVALVNTFEDYKASVNPQVWERAVLNEEFAVAKERFGDAIRSGSERELDDAMQRASQQRRLATALGKQKVLGRLGELKQEAEQARRDQKAAPAERSRAAKANKARGHGERNRAA
jgi:hypothetical protein